MKKILLFSILWVGLSLIACNDPVQTKQNTKTVNVPGEILVEFTSKVDIEDAYDLMEELSFQAIDFRNLTDETEPNVGIVGVPEGEEEHWSFLITHYPIVIWAQPRTKKVPA